MATERLSMTKTREILRKKWVLKLSYGEIGLSVGAAPSGVWQAIKRAERRGWTGRRWRSWTTAN
jgi:hypothetical protein